jgi:hypothetical protein
MERQEMDSSGCTSATELVDRQLQSGKSSGKVVLKIANVGGVPSLVLSLLVRTVAIFTSGPDC